MTTVCCEMSVNKPGMTPSSWGISRRMNTSVFPTQLETSTVKCKSGHIVFLFPNFQLASILTSQYEP